MKHATVPTLFSIVAIGVFATGMYGHAASKTDMTTPDIPKPAATPPAPAAPKPPPAPRPTTTLPRPIVPVRREPQPDRRYPLPGFPPGAKPTAATSGRVPIKSYPPPLIKPVPKQEPAEIPFSQVVLLSFSNGDSTAYAELLAAGGRRIDLSNCQVQWFLPKYQTGSISFAPTQSDQTYHPPGSLDFGADPGQPLKIYGRRTGVDGTARAVITFQGVETPVPREEKNPTDL